MREICKSGPEGGAGQINAPSLPLSNDLIQPAQRVSLCLAGLVDFLYYGRSGLLPPTDGVHDELEFGGAGFEVEF